MLGGDSSESDSAEEVESSSSDEAEADQGRHNTSRRLSRSPRVRPPPPPERSSPRRRAGAPRESRRPPSAPARPPPPPSSPHPSPLLHLGLFISIIGGQAVSFAADFVGEVRFFPLPISQRWPYSIAFSIQAPYSYHRSILILQSTEEFCG